MALGFFYGLLITQYIFYNSFCFMRLTSIKIIENYTNDALFAMKRIHMTELLKSFWSIRISYIKFSNWVIIHEEKVLLSHLLGFFKKKIWIFTKYSVRTSNKMNPIRGGSFVCKTSYNNLLINPGQVPTHCFE